MNGTRHIVTQIGKRLIKAQIAGGGPYDGNEILIPRILFHPEDKNLPFEFERCQFPVRVCGGMTANKAQGQGFSRVGIYLKNDFFSHGQCYVALSRATSPKGLSIYKPPTSNNANAHLYMKNVVYKEIL